MFPDSFKKNQPPQMGGAGLGRSVVRRRLMAPGSTARPTLQFLGPCEAARHRVGFRDRPQNEAKAAYGRKGLSTIWLFHHIYQVHQDPPTRQGCPGWTTPHYPIGFQTGHPLEGPGIYIYYMIIYVLLSVLFAWRLSPSGLRTSQTRGRDLVERLRTTDTPKPSEQIPKNLSCVK